MRQMVANIMKLFGKDAKRLVSPIVLSILDSLCNGVMLSMMILVMLNLSEGDVLSWNQLVIYTIVLIASFLLRCILQSVAFVQSMHGCSGAAANLRLRVGNHIRNLNLGYFNQNSIGSLAGTLTTDISDFELTLSHSLNDFIKVITFLTFTLIVVLFIDWRYAIVIVVISLISLPLLTLSAGLFSNASKKLRLQKQDMVSVILEYTSGIKTFRLYNLTGVRFKRLDDSLSGMKKTATRAELDMLPTNISFFTLVSLIIPAALFMGTFFLTEQSGDGFRFLAVVLMSVSISSMLMTLGSLYPQIRLLTNATNNILTVLREEPLPYENENLRPEHFDIEFENVSFGYTEDVDILKNISFFAKAGSTTALIGPSGSGKTTMASLVSRFWDVSDGEIRIGGIDIRRLHPDTLARYIAVVFQDVYLLNDTIMSNIRVGKRDATDEEVYSAAKAAHCHDFISQKENGYGTMVGEGGSTLSGGEKQRISIARALLKDAPIVLLDETTSNLDADNEREIQLAFDQLMKNKTVIVIAHRLNTIVNADNIVVLKKGEIAEHGTHNELMTQNGWYAKVFDGQTKARQWTVQNKPN